MDAYKLRSIIRSKENSVLSSRGLTISHAIMPFLVVAISFGAAAQTAEYPKEIRGYKVERAVVEIKRPESKQKTSKDQSQTDNTRPSREAQNPSGSGSDTDSLVQLGKPQLARVTPLGVTFELPMIIAPLKQSGHVDFVLFENMVVNETSVELDEYHRGFDLPNKKPLALSAPLRVYLYLPSAVLAAIDEWSSSKPAWPVKGRAYVCGSFKKSIFSFKRCVPVEINATIRNPLQNREP